MGLLDVLGVGFRLIGVRRDAESTMSGDGEPHPLLMDAAGRAKVSSTPGNFAPVDGVTSDVQPQVLTPVTNATVMADVTRSSNAVLLLTGVPNAMNHVFEASTNNGATWFAVQAVRSDSNTVESSTGLLSAAPSYAWELGVNSYTHVRVRCTARTGGSASWRITQGAFATEPIPAVQSHPVTVSSGAVTNTPSSGTDYVLVTTASTNAAVIKTSAGNLTELTVTNPTATAAYVKLYRKAAAPTVGTDVPSMTVPVPAGGLVNLELGALGKRFSTGIAIAVTAAAAATDTASAVAGVQVHATYL